MKKVIAVVFQLVLFLLVFLAGSFFPPFHLQHVLTATATETRLFIADGLILMLALYGIIVLIEVLVKPLRPAVLWSTLAIVLAAVLGFLMKFGFVTRSLY